MREVVKPGGAFAAFVMLPAAALLLSVFWSGGCGSQWERSARGDRGLPLRPVVLERDADLVDARAATPDIGIGGLLTGYQYRYRQGPPGPYRGYGLLTSAQITVETGAALSGGIAKLGRGKGWSMTFADNSLGGEGWIGGATYDIEGVSPDAHLFYIRGGFRMAYLDAPPLYAFVSTGVSADWLSSSEFGTLGTVNIGDAGYWSPVGFYFRFGGGLIFANVVVFGEFVTTGAWVSDVDYLTQGWLTTWGASIGVGVVF